MTETFEFINGRLSEAETAGRLTSGEDAEPDPEELAASDAPRVVRERIY